MPEYWVVEEDGPDRVGQSGPYSSYSAALNYLVSLEKDLRTERKFNVVTGEDDRVWDTSPIVNGWFEYSARGAERDPISVRIVGS